MQQLFGQKVLNDFIQKQDGKLIFVGECKFKTPMPSNVFRGISYTSYIRSFTNEKLAPLQIRQVLNKLQNKRLKQSFQTDRSHVSNLKERFNKPLDTDNCPKCRHTVPVA